MLLGSFVRALHRPSPADAPRNAVRGGPLRSRDEVTRQRVQELDAAGELNGAVALAVWDDVLAGPQWTGAPRWLHGDLHPANVLVDRGALTGVIDFGDITGGDPATDLAAGWMMFDAVERLCFREAAGHGSDDATWARGRGWALCMALAQLAGSADNPIVAAIGRRTLDAVLADA